MRNADNEHFGFSKSVCFPFRATCEYRIVTDSGVFYDRADSDTQTSISLLMRAKARDDRAWYQLVQLFSPLVYHWCRQWGLNSHDSENVAQDVFAVVCAKLKDFEKRAHTGAFRGWLKQITRHKLIDFSRAARGRPRAIGGSDGYALAATAAVVDDDDSVSREVQFLYERAVTIIRGRFSDRDWRAFYEFVVNGRPSKEIAAELGMSVNSVYLAKSRILSVLRAEFAGVIEGLDGNG